MDNPILTSRQWEVLNYLKQEPSVFKTFYLTGGTALAEFYLRHRYSEDLDFFSMEEVDPLAIASLWKKFKKELAITQVDFQQSFNRNLFFIHFNEEVLKTEFTYFPFPNLEPPKNENGIPVDSLHDIAVNKLFTIYQRTHARDYIDLFSICETAHFTIGELMKEARIKFDSPIDVLQLGSQFLKAEDAKDLPRLVKPLELEKWRSFFKGEAKKLRPNILD